MLILDQVILSQCWLWVISLQRCFFFFFNVWMKWFFSTSLFIFLFMHVALISVWTQVRFMKIRNSVQLGVHHRSERWLDIASGWKSTHRIDLFILEKQMDLCPSVSYFWCFSYLPKKSSQSQSVFQLFSSRAIAFTSFVWDSLGLALLTALIPVCWWWHCIVLC